MKYIYVIIFFFIFLGCEPVRPFYTNFVKLNATISDTAGTIRLGDTLKIKFTVPDTVVAVSNNGDIQKVFVSTLQDCYYAYTFILLDTVTHGGRRISGIYTVITKGYGIEGTIHVTNTNKPFSSILSFIPPAKGIYYLQITQQPTTLKINNSFEAGLAVNFAVTDKHWVENAAYFNGPNQPDFITSVTQADRDGYGFYVFRVN